MLAELIARAAPGLELDRSSEARLRDFVCGLDRGQRLRLEGALRLIGDGL